MNVNQNLPLPTERLIDPISGQMTSEWYRFFLTMFNRTGGGSGIATDDVLSVAILGPSVGGPESPPDIVGATLLHTGDAATKITGVPASALALSASDAVPPDILRSALLLADWPPSRSLDVLLAALFDGVQGGQSSPPIIGVTLGASPALYRAPVDGNLLITGGTVSAIDLTRDGTTFLSAGIIAGFVPMARGDQARVTYTVAPTAQNFIPG